MLKLTIEIELPEGISPEEVIEKVGKTRRNAQRMNAQRAAQQGKKSAGVDETLSNEQFIIEQIKTGILSDYFIAVTSEAGRKAQLEKQNELSDKFKALK